MEEQSRLSAGEDSAIQLFWARKTATFFYPNGQWPLESTVCTYVTYVHFIILCGDGIAFGLGFLDVFCFECQEVWQNEGVWKF